MQFFGRFHDQMEFLLALDLQTTFNTLLSSLELAFYTQVCLYLAFKKLHDHLS